MTSFQPGRPQAPTLRPALGGPRTTPGRYNEDMEQLIFRMHQMLIDELDAEQISAMPADERRKVVEQAAETLLRREMPGVTISRNSSRLSFSDREKLSVYSPSTLTKPRSWNGRAPAWAGVPRGVGGAGVGGWGAC